MWNWAILFLFILHADAKSSNLCRMNSPRCDGEKIIKVEKTICVKAKDPVLWTFNEQTIGQICDGVNNCNIDKMVDVVLYCCGDEEYRLNKRPKLRFVYDCVQGQVTTTKSTTPRMTTTLPAVVNTVSTKHTTAHSSDFDNFCVTNVCHQKPYCSAGTEIAVMKISDTLESDEVMNSLTYYCNKRQRCSEEFEPYIDNKCRSEDSMKLHYVCMKEKLTTTVMCDYDETIDNLEGQIRSSDYPNMIPASTSHCRIKILFDKPSIVELFLLDLPTVEVMYANEYMEWSAPMSVSARHEFIPSSSEVLLSVDFDKLPQRRIWMYYRVFPTMTVESNVESDLMWTTTCMNHVTTPEPMNMTTPKNTPSTPEMSKVTMFKVSNSTNPGKDMNPVHKTDANQVAQESSTTSHIVIPDGIPVDTEVGDKMAASTFPAMLPTARSGTSTSSSSNSNGSDGHPVKEAPHHPTRREKKNKVSSVSGTPTTGLYSREVVIATLLLAGTVSISNNDISKGLIAGVVILACLVIILLTALAASMRRRRRSLADAEERDARHNSGPAGTTNENLVSFQYLKTLPADGDNGTLGTRSQESGGGGDSLGGDSTSKRSLISKIVSKKNSLAPSETGSNKTADTMSSKDDSVFHCVKNVDDFSDQHSERSKSIDSGLATKTDNNSFIGRSRLDADLPKYVENHDVNAGDDVFRDVSHFYVNGDDYALVQKDSSRSPRSTLISDRSIYDNSSPRPKSGSSGSVQDSDVLEWTKGFNLAV